VIFRERRHTALPFHGYEEWCMQRDLLRADTVRLDRQDDFSGLAVADWVQNNKGLICNAIFAHYQGCPEDVKNDLLCDAVTVAYEAADKARWKGKSFEALFWTDFRIMLQGSIEFHVICDQDLVDNAMISDDMTHRIIERFEREDRVCRAINNALKVLSPREQDLLLLISGETNLGRCSLPDAAKILTITVGSVGDLLKKINTKISEATKVYRLGGEVDFFALQPYQVKKGRPSLSRSWGSYVNEDTFQQSVGV